MALAPEQFIIDQVQKIIRQEGQGSRAAHRFANQVMNDPIISYRLRELRTRSMDHRPPPPKRRRPPPRAPESSEPFEPYEPRQDSVNE
jgi:hypothetical protein